MKIYQVFDEMMQYLSDAVAQIFGVSEERYPAIGVQPFEGEPFRGQMDEAV